MKKFQFFLAVVVLSTMALFAVSCNGDDPVDEVVEVAVTGVEITNPSPLKLMIGETATLEVNVLPENATNPEFKVTVADPSIVEISDTYVIKALAEGTTTVTVETLDGGKKDTLEIEVLSAAIEEISVAEFFEKEVDPNVWYKLTGVIKQIADDEYGYFFLQDGEDIVYVYGLTKTKVAENDKSFAALELKVGDTLTLIGTRDNDEKAELDRRIRVGGPAYYVSHVAAVEPPKPVEMTFDIKVSDEPDADNYYYATVTPSDMERKYVAMGISQADLDCYVAEKVIPEPTVEAFIEAAVLAPLRGMYEANKDTYTFAQVIDAFLTESGLNGIYEDLTLIPQPGKNYVFAFTLDSEGNVIGLDPLMYLEIKEAGALKVELNLVEARAKDIGVSLKFPSDWIKDPKYPDDNHPIMFGWGKKSEIGNMTDEELVARDFEVLKVKAAEYEMEVAAAIPNYQWIWRDYVDPQDPLFLAKGSGSLYEEVGFEPNTEYVIYAYAMQYDYKNNGVFAATGITRMEATTLEVVSVDLNFTFGIDRIQYDSYGDLLAYFTVEADNAEQRFIFDVINEKQLVNFSEDGTAPAIEDVATLVLEAYIAENNGAWWSAPLDEWTYFGHASSSKYDGVEVSSNAAENRYYVVAAAMDTSFNIVSDVQYELIDLTGKTSTDAVITLDVEGSEGAFTYSVTSDTTPYIVTTIAVDEMEKWLSENYYYDKEVSTYVNAQVEKALETTTAAEYLKANGTSASVNESVTITKDTYVIAYTLYESSGVVNGLVYEFMEAPLPEAVVVNLTDADGVKIDFDSAWSKYKFCFSWNEGAILFFNEDGDWDNTVYEYTHTMHIILGQTYSYLDKTYGVDLDYTYKGDPESSYAAGNLFAKKATVVVNSNEDGTYTFTADIVYTDQTRCQYIYTGAIADEVINGSK